MISILTTVVSMQLAAMPSEETIRQFEERSYTYTGGSYENAEFGYRLLEPRTIEPGRKYPLVFFLHGAGERGDDNKTQLAYLPEMMARSAYREKYPCFLLAPQCRKGEHWGGMSRGSKEKVRTEEVTHSMRAALEALDDVEKNFPIDPSRIYLTGLSMGGYGSWDLAARFPDRFAAVVPICGGGDVANAPKLVGIPLWAFHGANDNVVPPERSREMIEAIGKAGGNAKYTEFPGLGHNSWTAAYDDPGEAVPWMFQQKNERLVAGATVKSTAKYAPRLAVGMYAWTQDRGKKGTNLWDDFDAVLGEVRAAGFDAVEGFLNFFDSDERAERARKYLVKNGVTLAGLYTGGLLHDEAQGDKTLEKILATVDRVLKYVDDRPYIDVNPAPLPGGKQKTDAQLSTQVRLLNRLGGELARRGLQLVIHQHAPEIHHGGREHRYNVRHVDPAVVGFCLDTHWVFRGGQDPLTFVKEAGPMIKAFHLRNSKDGVWSESFGPGDIDHAPIAGYLRQNGFTGWLVLELASESKTKITRPLVENTRLGREYLRSVFLSE